MNHDLNRDDYIIEPRERSLTRYPEPVRPLFPRFRWGRMTEAELIVRAGRLTRLREEENFRTEVMRQNHRIYLVFNEEVAEHDAAVMADVKKRSTEAKAEILKALDRQDEKARAEAMIEDPIEAREVQKKIDAIYDDQEPLPITPKPGNSNGTRIPGRVQKEPPEKESII